MSDEVRSRQRARNLSSHRLVSIGVGFGIGIAALLALVSVVGPQDVLAAFSEVRVSFVAVLLGGAVAWLVAWGLALRAVLSCLDIATTRSRSIAVYATLAFANGISPFALVGSQPMGAYFLTRSVRTRFETALAAVAAMDLLTAVPAFGFVLVGVGYLSLVSTVTGVVEAAAIAFLVAVVLLTVLGSLLWHSRAGLERMLASTILRVISPVYRLRAEATVPSRSAIETRIGRFTGSIDRLRRNPRQLGIAILAATAGWLCLAGTLWLSVLAVGGEVTPLVAVVTLPIATAAAVVPVPGGAGAIEVALVTLLVGLGGQQVAVATAGALLYRGATYAFPLGLGAVSLAGLSVRR